MTQYILTVCSSQVASDVGPGASREDSFFKESKSINKMSAPNFSFGNEPREKDPKIVYPGPGAYVVSKSSVLNKKFTLGSRTNFSRHPNEDIGPGRCRMVCENSIFLKIA